MEDDAERAAASVHVARASARERADGALGDLLPKAGAQQTKARREGATGRERNKREIEKGRERLGSETKRERGGDREKREGERNRGRERERERERERKRETYLQQTYLL